MVHPHIIESGNNNYTLLTGDTKESITCPEGDVTVQAQDDGTVKLIFLKNCIIKD